MTSIAMGLWGLSSIIISIMIVKTVVRYINYNKMAEKPAKLLSFREEKIWLSGIVVMLLMVRYFIVFAVLFSDNPNPVVNGALLRQYFKGLFFSLIWPIQLPTLIGSVVIYIINRKWKRRSRMTVSSVCNNKTVFIGVCVAFFILVVVIYTLHLFDLVSFGTVYTMFLFGKCIALVVVLMSLSEKKDAII